MEGKLGRLINRVRGGDVPDSVEEAYEQVMSKYRGKPQTISEDEMRVWLKTEGAKRGITLIGDY